MPLLVTTGRRKRKIKRYELRVFILVIASMALFPIFYLHHHLLSPPTNATKYNKDKSSKIHRTIREFYETKKKRRQHQQSLKKNPIRKSQSGNPKVLTAYLESSSTLNSDISPLPIRNSSESSLKKITFPRVKNCSTLMQDFPIDDYPLEDPFLPWIHDFFPSIDGKSIQFVAQNRRRCNTGEHHVETMEFWEPQIALFQPIPIIVESEKKYRLAPNLEAATHKMTRFQCLFHTIDGSQAMTTFSEYPFNYEYINYRKSKLSMFSKTGKDMDKYWISQLLFSCPVPPEFQSLLQINDDQEGVRPTMYLDLIPIRTPAREKKFMLTVNDVGIASLPASNLIFDGAKTFGNKHYLPLPKDSGRVRYLFFHDKLWYPSS